MGNKKQRIIPSHYSWNSSIFTRGVVDPIKRRLGWIDESERPVSLKESATGQELDRMKETAKDAGKLVATGLAFGNPVTTSSTIAPLITGSQAYFMTEGLKDAYDRVISPNKTTTDGAMVALDVTGAVPAFSAIRNGAKYVLPTAAKTVAPALMAKQISKTKLSTVEPTLNIGWGPKQTLKVSRAGEYNQMYFPERWDVVNEGANPHGVWLQGKYGIPRTDVTNPGKGIKAAKARNIFSARPDKYTGTATLDKPIVTVGEVPNRSLLSYQADNMGADGLVYNGVYDNGYNNNQVILSFRRPKLTKIQLSEAERLGIPKHERNWDYQFFKSIKERNPALTSYIRTKHFAEQSADNKLTSSFFPKGRTLDEDMWFSADDNLWKYYQNNKKDLPIKMTHKSPNDFYVFDYTRQSKYPDGHFFFSMHDRPQFGKGKISKDFYIYDKNVKPISEYTGDDLHIIDKNTGNYLLRELDSNSANSALLQDAVHNKTPNTIYGYDSGSNFVEGMYEFAVPRNTQMKLVDPITYDNNGHIIKLSKRDNFKNPDFRYKQGGILKRVESGKSGIHIKPENRGKFTALKKRTGKSSTWYKEHGTPAQKKMAVFALNARKWKHK